MPVLSAETAVFPENLLDEPGCDGVRSWWISYTKPRQEKALARDLVDREIPFYLPAVRRQLLVRGKRVISRVPLFPSYVFVHSTPEERQQAIRTNRVCHSFVVEDAQQLLADLQRVRQLIESDAPLTVEARLSPGDRVRVKAGSLLGLEGTVIRRQRQTRLLVAVHFLQQGVSVEIDDCYLEPIG
jgi:transcriptional antiterminator RfaH